MVEGILTGGGVAIFAFTLATARDTLKGRRERQEREQATLAAIREEITANKGIAEDNWKLLEREMEMLADNMRLLNPLDPLGSGFWEIVRVSPPQRVARDERALASVRNVARLTLQVNEVLRSRENFRTLSPLLRLKTTMTREAGSQARFDRCRLMIGCCCASTANCWLPSGLSRNTSRCRTILRGPRHQTRHGAGKNVVKRSRILRSLTELQNSGHMRR